jgi:hypothetical protein
VEEPVRPLELAVAEVDRVCSVDILIGTVVAVWTWIYENLARVRGNQELGKIECVISLYDEMMSIYPKVFQTYTPRRSVHLRYRCISVRPPPASPCQTEWRWR